MEQQPDSSIAGPNPFRTWGLWAALTGAVALILVFMQISLPQLEPRPSAGQQIGEIAGEIKRAAWRTLLGLPKPEAIPEPASLIRTAVIYCALAAPFFGVIAVVLSLVSGVLREDRRFAYYGASLGAAAIFFQFFWWVALLIVAVVLIGAILDNIGDIFSF